MLDLERCRAGAAPTAPSSRRASVMQEQRGRSRLAPAEHPTLADLAVFPDVILFEERGVSPMPYPALRRWTDRVERIPGFVVMPGTFPADRL